VRRIFEPQNFFSSTHGLAIDIISPDIDKKNRIIERWLFSFLTAQGDTSEQKNRTLTRKLCVGLRSLLCYTRLLPGYSIFRRSLLEKSSQERGPSYIQAHHTRMDEETQFDENPVLQSKQEFLLLPSSIGTLRLRVSVNRFSSASDPDVKQHSKLLHIIEVEEGYVEKEVDGERDLWKVRTGSEGAAPSVCSTTPDDQPIHHPLLIQLCIVVLQSRRMMADFAGEASKSDLLQPARRRHPRLLAHLVYLLVRD